MEYDAYVANQNAIKKAEADAKTAYAVAQKAEQAKLKAEQAKQAKRKAEFDAVTKTYKAQLEKNPYSKAEKERQWAINNQFGKGNRRKFLYSWEVSQNRYNAQAQQAKQEAEKKLRLQNYTADGFQFASGGTGQSDFGKAVSDYKMGRPLGYIP